ncbi:MAG: RNA pyrophosphohydrolase [Holosporaceae bacterium]|jgi:putative (di)nucleoside polyphosphate hydrolase|nr:RNA pyrophosphohydrolase [Holosporaceae bacterium]
MLPYRKCVAILLIKESKIFVGRRVDLDDAWQLPQGGVNEGESYLEAAKRELFEETNISTVEFLGSSNLQKYDFPPSVQKIIIKKRGKLKYSGQEIIFLAFKFLGEETEINLQKEFKEFDDWKWVTMEELLNNIVYFKKIPYKKAIAELLKQGVLD